jgi:hypothetical protein
VRFADDFCKKAETLIVDVLDSEGQDHVVDLADRDPPALTLTRIQGFPMVIPTMIKMGHLAVEDVSTIVPGQDVRHKTANLGENPHRLKRMMVMLFKTQQLKALHKLVIKLISTSTQHYILSFHICKKRMYPISK